MPGKSKATTAPQVTLRCVVSFDAFNVGDVITTETGAWVDYFVDEAGYFEVVGGEPVASGGDVQGGAVQAGDPGDPV